MSKRYPFLVFAAALSLAGTARAQDARGTDPRLYPFLGCWRSDTVGARSAQLGMLTCVVPVAGSPDIDLLSLVDGRVLSRRRIEANTRVHSVDGQGCRGQERTSWSPLVRRVYLRAEYVCTTTGIAGGSTTLFSFLPTGEWLEVENVRSGGGSIMRVERRRDVGVPNNLPREVAGQIGGQRLAVVTARAEAAAPLATDDIVEALRNSDSAVVRVWLAETAQHFQLSGDQFAALTRAEVPAPVLQAMMSVPPKYQLGVGVDANGRSTDEYLSTPGWPAGYPNYPYGYYPYGYYPYGPAVYSNVYVYGYPGPYYASYNYYYPPAPTYTYSHYSAYSNYSPYSYRSYPYSLQTYQHYPVYNSYRAPSYFTNPVGVHAGQSQVRVMPASRGPVGRRP